MNEKQMTIRIEIFVQDPDFSTEFYSRILRFNKIKEHSYQGGTYIAITNGKVHIGILSQTAVLKDFSAEFSMELRRPPVGPEIVLEVENIEEYYNYVCNSKYPIAGELQDRPWGARDFRLYDPDGYYLRLTSR
ncbi:VOC family protein [Nitrincola sp. MINF-07-Sa-05]|uniref:VOC family protein n=1 Tax=Nitrincola salilacus TaxID=3400273 RepID=UPI0039185A51